MARVLRRPGGRGGAAFLMLQACHLLAGHPAAFLDELRLTNPEVDGTTIDLLIERHPHDVGVSATRPVEGVEIVVVE